MPFPRPMSWFPGITVICCMPSSWGKTLQNRAYSRPHLNNRYLHQEKKSEEEQEESCYGKGLLFICPFPPPIHQIPQKNHHPRPFLHPQIQIIPPHIPVRKRFGQPHPYSPSRICILIDQLRIRDQGNLTVAADVWQGPCTSGDGGEVNPVFEDDKSEDPGNAEERQGGEVARAEAPVEKTHLLLVFLLQGSRRACGLIAALSLAAVRPLLGFPSD